jgi:hypothetical protein
MINLSITNVLLIGAVALGAQMAWNRFMGS